MNDQLRKSVTQVLRLLVAGQFDELEVLTNGVRLSSEEIGKAVSGYGKMLVLPPEDGFRLMEIIEIKNAQPKRWSITMPLWTQEEGRSDLTMEMTVIERQEGIAVELDDIHVL